MINRVASAAALALRSRPRCWFADASPRRSRPRRNCRAVTPSGNYLAGRQANILRDAAAASAYYRAALRADPRIPNCSNSLSISVLAEGDIDEAVKLADRLLAVDKNNRNTRLVLGVRAIKQKQYAAARQQFAQAARGPITDLTATLLTAWALYGAGDAKGAVATIDRLTGPDWYAIFKDFHAGLILDLAGNNARRPASGFERAYKLEPNALRDRAGLRPAGCRATATRKRRSRCFRISTRCCPIIR